jgi:hypothetical protein
MSIEITDEMVDQVAKIVADCMGNGMREKYIDVARDILTAVAPLMQAKVADGVVPVHIVCDWEAADPFLRFIEAETPEGKPVRLAWHDRSDTLKEFHLYAAAPEVQS